MEPVGAAARGQLSRGQHRDEAPARTRPRGRPGRRSRARARRRAQVDRLHARTGGRPAESVERPTRGHRRSQPVRGPSQQGIPRRECACRPRPRATTRRAPRRYRRRSPRGSPACSRWAGVSTAASTTRPAHASWASTSFDGRRELLSVLLGVPLRDGGLRRSLAARRDGRRPTPTGIRRERPEGQPARGGRSPGAGGRARSTGCCGTPRRSRY